MHQGGLTVVPPPLRAPLRGIERALERAPRGMRPAVVLGDLTLIRPLGWSGIPVVAVGTASNDVSFRSRYVSGHVVLPGFLPPHEKSSVDTLVSLGSALGAAARGRPPLVYGTDAQLEMLYRNRDALESKFLFVLNDDELAWALHDKARFARLCERAGVRHPTTVIPGPEQSLARALAGLRGRLLVKPRTKSDWKSVGQALFAEGAKARVFSGAAELLRHRAFPWMQDRVIVQEYIDAPVSGLLSFHGFVAPDGRLLAWFCGRKLRTYPATAGESALVELVEDAELARFGRDVVERLGLRGPFKIDIIRHPRTGELYVLEVNARYNLWHHLGAVHGVNLPLLAYDYLVDGHCPLHAPAYHPRLRWLNLYLDAKAARESKGSRLRWLASLLVSRKVHEIFSWRDPLPFLAWVGGLVSARLSRRGNRRWLPSA